MPDNANSKSSNRDKAIDIVGVTTLNFLSGMQLDT